MRNILNINRDCGSTHIEALAKCGAVAAILDAIYYLGFASEYFVLAASNMLLLVIVAIAFYGYHLWAAGDSKLLFVVGLSIPGRFYSFWDIGIWSGFVIIVLTFSIAFIFLAPFENLPTLSWKFVKIILKT